MINHKNNQTLIDTIMLPFLRNLQHLNIRVAAFDLEGKFIFINNITQASKKDKTQLINRSILDMQDLSNNKLVETYEIIRKKVIATKNLIQYLYITNNHTKLLDFFVYIEQHIPFFNTQQEVIATYIIGSPLTPLNIEKILFTQTEPLKNVEHNLKLTTRQHEILFLLCYNITQNNIAKHLNIARSTVSQIIFKQLIPKFENIKNIDDLIDIAIKNGINFKVPGSLIYPKIFIIE